MIVGIIFILVAITSSVLSVLISVMHVQEWRKGWRKGWDHRVLAVGYGVMAVLLPILAAVVLFRYVLK